MKSKYEHIRNYLHYLPRSISFRMIDNYDLTDRERDILKSHELDKKVSIKELAAKYNVDERCILRSKQIALKKICNQLDAVSTDPELSFLFQ